ncbi:formimidoylglutamase [Rothia kristinae]|uniref:Formimidoylglutamase n=1 Tax=Rothia kristinae TaxID=37923 RepID=A0A1S2N4D5_9MICC|nr:formimidoylglutamase [Rothia kristinae]OIJ36756.1 formimidoylglutamase [Rothia kristinae]
MSTTPWQGRDDGPGAIHTRWHHMVYAGQKETGEEAQSLAVLGFDSHEGTIRSQGRPGAAEGPHRLRHALAQLAFHGANVVHDRGDIAVDGHHLEEAQVQAGRRIAEAVRDHRMTLVLGGGHETSYAGYLGLAASGRLDGVRTWGVISFDTHLGTAQEPQATATTVFDQIARAERKAGREFRYVALGISEADNTRARFENAGRIGARYLKDAQLREADLPEAESWLEERLADLEVIYLSVDLDVLPGETAPGVSAPATLGVPLFVVERLARRVARTGKVAVLDVVGLVPRLDLDERTARAGARLIHWITADGFERPAADASSETARPLLAERQRHLDSGTADPGGTTAIAQPVTQTATQPDTQAAPGADTASAR